jgi:hypothetical protein
LSGENYTIRSSNSRIFHAPFDCDAGFPNWRNISISLITVSGKEPQINDKAFLERSEKKIPILLQIPDAWARMPVRRVVWV